MSDPNENPKRIVSVTVGTLRAFEKAVNYREGCRYSKEMARLAFDQAKLAFERAVREESDAIDGVINASRVLFE